MLLNLYKPIIIFYYTKSTHKSLYFYKLFEK